MTRRDPGILLTELRHVTGELQRLCGAPLRGVWVPDPHTVALELGRETLLLETWPLPRAHTVARRPASPAHPLSFQGLLRARADGPLLSLELLCDDRAIALRFPTGTLEARLFGRGGGIWWREGDRVIASASGPAPEVLPDLRGADASRSPRFGPRDGSWDLGARDWFDAAALGLEEDRWRAHVRGGLRRQLAHVARRVHHLRDDLDRAERAGALRAEADALAASLHRWPGRMPHVTVEDPDGGESLVIELDPSISVSANMQRRYARAARLERGAEGTLTRLLEGEEQQVVLQALVDQVDRADLLALRALAQRARLGPPDTHRAGPPEPLGGHWRWRDASNHLIRVGRHDAGNQELVFRVARGRDTWLHLKDRPSPHVIVSADGKGGASPSLIDAGEQLLLAAAKVPLGESAEVQRARVADLRAIPGARLGSVRVLRAEVRIATRRSESLAGWTRDELAAPP